jgi:First Longin domain of INTU, CCZ1 and HPS4
MSTESGIKIIPARLSFLSIFNPTLGTTDETFQDQIVFHYSRAARIRRKSGSHDAEHDRRLQEEENEKLRQIGLAQGMVDFAKYPTYLTSCNVNKRLTVVQEFFQWQEN